MEITAVGEKAAAEKTATVTGTATGTENAIAAVAAAETEIVTETVIAIGTATGIVTETAIAAARVTEAAERTKEDGMAVTVAVMTGRFLRHRVLSRAIREQAAEPAAVRNRIKNLPLLGGERYPV